MRKQPTQAMASEFRRNRGRTRLRSAVALLLAAVLAVLANVLAARLCTSVNITPPLSERSKDILGQVSGEVETVVEQFQIPLMVGAVDPDDPEKGIEAFRNALKEAGIEELKKEVEDQYETWKIETKK